MIPLSSLARRWSATPPNLLAAEIETARREGRAPLDIVTSNPHENGLEFPAGQIEEIVARAMKTVPSARVYRPDSRGQPAAREAIAAYYQRRGARDANPERIVLTAGTSLGYYYALRILLEPGDELLAPSPSYPLFDDLCAAADVHLRLYHLAERPEAEGGWRPDLDDIEFQITPRTRAIIVVSPHNPTGCVFSAAEWERLGALCRGHNLAVILDEVFCEFLAPGAPALPRPRPGEFPLVITLNGFSKMFSLPGWKVAWMKADGADGAEVARFLTAVEHLSDTFLPVNEVAQAAVPAVFEAGDPAVCGALAREYAQRRELALAHSPLPVHRPEGGVYLCPRLPEGIEDEAIALRALREQNLLIHPGYYYNLPSHLVMTCVSAPERLLDGLGRLRRVVGDK